MHLTAPRYLLALPWHRLAVSVHRQRKVPVFHPILYTQFRPMTIIHSLKTHLQPPSSYCNPSVNSGRLEEFENTETYWEIGFRDDNQTLCFQLEGYGSVRWQQEIRRKEFRLVMKPTYSVYKNRVSLGRGIQQSKWSSSCWRSNNIKDVLLTRYSDSNELYGVRNLDINYLDHDWDAMHGPSRCTLGAFLVQSFRRVKRFFPRDQGYDCTQTKTILVVLFNLIKIFFHQLNTRDIVFVKHLLQLGGCCRQRLKLSAHDARLMGCSKTKQKSIEFLCCSSMVNEKEKQSRSFDLHSKLILLAEKGLIL